MKAFIKSLISNKIINRVIREILLKGISINKALINTIQKYVPVSGVVSLSAGESKIKFITKSDDHFVTKSFYHGFSEMQELKLFQSLARQTDTIYDIGANVGLYSLLGGRVNSKNKIYAFEPDSFVFGRLKENIKINGLENIEANQYAIGDSVELKKLYSLTNDVNTTTSSLYLGQTLQFYPDEEVKNEIIQQTTIDHLVYYELQAKPNLLKIDVELNELNVLKGAQRTLHELKPIILIEIFNAEIKTQFNPKLANEIDHNYTKSIEKILRIFGYNFYVIGHSGILRVNDFRSNPDNSNYILSTIETKKLFFKWEDVQEFSMEISAGN